ADVASRRDGALAWASAELDGAVRALEPVPPATDADLAGYRIAAYLDKQGRRTRRDRLGPASLWDALTAGTAGTGDLTRVAQAAPDRGLYRHPAAGRGAPRRRTVSPRGRGMDGRGQRREC